MLYASTICWNTSSLLLPETLIGSLIRVWSHSPDEELSQLVESEKERAAVDWGSSLVY